MQSIARSDVALVLIDAMEQLTHQDLTVIMHAVERRKGVVLVVNKWDLLEKQAKTFQEYEKSLRERLKNLSYIPIITISCLTKLRVHQVIQVALSVFLERNKRIPTAELNEKLGTILREQPPLVKDNKMIRVHYVTQVKASPPTFALFTNRPQAIEENYKRFVEHKIREQYGFLGMPLTIIVRKK